MTFSTNTPNGYLSLCYHYIRDNFNEKSFPRILGTSVTEFEKHIEMFSNHFKLITPSDALSFSYGDYNFNNNEVGLLDSGNNCVSKAKIVLNGNDRISEREGKYFNLVQPYQHHTTCPAPGINVYSFALTPEDHQPSGTCNFSRNDNAHLNVTLSDNTIGTTYNSGSATIKIYAINYNILRIMSGMGGLAYSN